MVAEFRQGGYRFIPGVFQYSAGVEALPGFEIERVRFSRPVALEAGFGLIERVLADEGVPGTAFCACELRSPAPFTEDGFAAFNTLYVDGLKRLGLMAGADNPVARSNVCPAVLPPAEPSFHAFCFARPSQTDERTFVIAGSAEVPEGMGNYLDHAIARGDLSEAGMAAKVDYVLAAMEDRLGALGRGWADTTGVQVYTVHDIHPHIAGAMIERIGQHLGLTLHHNRPPVQELEFEMDCRRVLRERVLPV
ncbi:hypothetical protein EMQ25_02020 [Arsenicitalea aurantiaca]|uniref:Uncharacterized protein n=1 Tax=Arsenicitalea aurantiaca TaxID=1783274 RepID=A0A433XL26_9HYPH|nr:hypothetical protein [Arsenicitalea aurantiaca]RUT34763.1 hypothetical protein EMQ25_02020 [Arsenicitalea aurantiaca]